MKITNRLAGEWLPLIPGKAMSSRENRSMDK